MIRKTSIAWAKDIPTLELSGMETDAVRKRNIRLILATMLLLMLLGSQVGRWRPARAQGNTGLVLAFYYAWYNPGSFGPGKTAFQPPQPYQSGDPATIRRHVQQARGAGIDGFVQSWYGPADPVTDGNFQTLLDIAGANGFQAAVDLEPATFLNNHDERANALRTLLETHATHPAYLRVDGKPVIFFWANWAYSVNDWAYIRNIADPDHNSIWIAEGSNTDHLAVFDGLHLYNTAWAANPLGIASTWAANTRAAAQTYGGFRYWVATAMPGFDDRHLGRGENSVYRDRAGGAYYQNSFAAAAASNPDMLIITSFNEWAEGSNVEPSVSFGNTYLDLTAQLVSAYKSGGVAAPPPLPEPTGEAGEKQEDAASTSGAETPLPTPLPATGPSPSPTAQPDGSIVYEVSAGDTLSDIAARFQVPLQDLYTFNGLDSDSLLSIGQRIVIGYSEDTSAATRPAPIPAGVEVREDGALIYRVQEGDTLIGIAVSYNLTLEEILALNEGLAEDDLLTIGQQIVVGQRREPQSVGGSTDFPAGSATPVSSPSPTATGTPLPTPTAQPTATSLAAAAAELAVAATSTTEPVATAANAPAPGSGSAGPAWLPLAGGFILLLGLMGGALYYLGWRRSRSG